LAVAASTFMDCFHRYPSVDFTPNSHVNKLAVPSRVMPLANIPNYLLLTEPAQVSSRALPRPIPLLLPADVIKSWRHVVLLLHTSLGALPQQKI